MRGLAAATLVLALTGAGWLGWQEVLRRHHLALLPPALSVTDRLAAYETAAGWGPGGNESGLILYRMPDALAALLAAGEPPAAGALAWQATPFLAEGSSDGALGPCAGDDCRSIDRFLWRYGHGVELPQDVEEMVDQALRTPGNRVGVTRSGLVLLIPGEKRVVYAYAG
jgi:hypothetical protein